MNNRIIKFRAWIFETKEIIDVWKIDFNKNQIIWVDGNEEIYENYFSGYKQDCEIMQFTGLTDKNGKEIYEGDIVEVKYRDGSRYDNPVEVSFENGSFWVGMGYLNDVKIIEVIGNVFQDYISGISLPR